MSTPAQNPQGQKRPDPNPQTQEPPAAPIPMPYIPTNEEMAYLEDCGKAIAKGCDAASTATDTGNAQEYLNFANGVKALTAAYVEIKTGGKAATGHQGS